MTYVITVACIGSKDKSCIRRLPGRLHRRTELLVNVAEDVANGRLVIAQEGSYSPSYPPLCVLAIMEALTGPDTPAGDPYPEFLESCRAQEMLLHERVAVERAAANLDRADHAGAPRHLRLDA